MWKKEKWILFWNELQTLWKLLSKRTHLCPLTTPVHFHGITARLLLTSVLVKCDPPRKDTLPKSWTMSQHAPHISPPSVYLHHNIPIKHESPQQLDIVTIQQQKDAVSFLSYIKNIYNRSLWKRFKRLIWAFGIYNRAVDVTCHFHCHTRYKFI